MLMKIIFFGTPNFAVEPLKKLHANYQIQAVVTQIDKPKGRGHKLTIPPIKELAIELGIQVLQPSKIKCELFLDELRAFDADIFVVVAYGKILPKVILDLPKYGCLNIHGSLLPKYRGAAPIQWAIINNEKTTGITVMQMDEGLDTGPMLLKKEIDILENDTSDTMFDKLSSLGAKAILEALDLIKNNKEIYTPQDNSLASFAPILTKEMGRINWNDSTDQILGLIKGLNPWPSAYTYLDDKNIKLWHAQKSNITDPAAKNGQILKANPKDGLIIKTSDGSLLITELQEKGKKRMDTKSYLLGNKIEENKILN